MWTRTENQAKHILLNRTRDGMRVQVNVFLMKENDWRLSLGGHSSFYTPNVFKLKMTVCCLTSQSIHLFPSSAVSVWSNNDSLSKLLLRSLCRLKLVCASDGSGFCYPEVWINSVTNWRLFVCTVPSWQGGVLVDEVETPQSSSSHHRLLFCLTLSRTHTTWCPHRARLCTRGCVCGAQQEASFRRSLAENETFPTMHWDDESITNVSRVCVGLMRKWWNLCS